MRECPAGETGGLRAQGRWCHQIPSDAESQVLSAGTFGTFPPAVLCFGPVLGWQRPVLQPLDATAPFTAATTKNVGWKAMLLLLKVRMAECQQVCVSRLAFKMALGQSWGRAGRDVVAQAKPGGS